MQNDKYKNATTVYKRAVNIDADISRIATKEFRKLPVPK